MDNPSESTIFEALRYSGENFFDNKKALEEVRDEIKKVCETAKRDFNKNSSDSDKATQQINNQIFNSIKIKPTPKLEYDQRRECSDEENRIIEEACRDKGKSLHQIEDIKFSLGFKSQNRKNLEYKKPCVAVVGQTKSGKSSLINALLRGRVVPQKVSRQTARVTYLTYCETNFVAYLKNCSLIKIKIDEMIKEEDVDLKFEERRKTEQVNIEVRLGTKNAILQNGFDIVDSPGLNENPALNDLCRKMERSLLPLLIYVVDGRNGLTESDASDIKGIMQHTPELRIIYFVTKLDRSVIDRAMYDDKKKRKGLGENEEIEGESDVDVAKRRLTNVYTKLQKNGFVSTTQQFDKCLDFNGVNLVSVHEIRKLAEPPKTEIDKYTKDRFEKFEKNILMDLKNMIEGPLKEDFQSIQAALQEVLEMTTTIASNIVEEKSEKLNSLEKFKKGEEKLYSEQKEKIENNLKDKIDKMIKQYEADLLRVVENHRFQSKELNSLNKHKRNPTKYDEHLRAFRFEIKDLIEKSLNKEIKDFIGRFMQENDDNLAKELNSLIERLTTGKYGRSSFEEMLKTRLYYDYDLYEECRVRNSEDYQYQPKKRKKINEVINNCKDILSKFQFHESRRQDDDQLDPQDFQWKEGEAKKILSDFDREMFLKNICRRVTDELESSHDKFKELLTKETNFLDSDFNNVGDKERDCLKTFSEDLAIQYAEAFIVNTNMQLIIDSKKKAEFLNEGGQAKLERVYVIDQVEPLVKKTYHNVFESFKKSTRLRSIGLEVYYTSRLTDPRFLSLLGITTETVGEGMKFSSYYPYLELGSLKTYLENDGSSINERKRLKLGVDIAGGIQHLHKLGIIHRDITLKNMLVRKDSSDLHAIIADYGVLNSLGFANRQKVGTALYIPSEVYNEMELETMGYSFSSDVYSFGVTLWQLLSYRITDKCKNYEPQFAIDCDLDEGKIKEKVKEGAHPESREEINGDLYAMMKQCWNLIRDERPSFIKPMNKVLPNCDRNPMKDKTIVQYLEEKLSTIGE